MSKVVPIKLPDGTVLGAEIGESESTLPKAIARGSLEEVDFAAALKRVEVAAGLMMQTLVNIKPKECELTFGIKLGGKAGVIFAEGTAEANFTVKLKWTS